MPEYKNLCGLLNRIGNFDPRKFKSDFNARMILQKTVYLLQSFGLYLGYPYSWYLRGPYSPNLAKDAYLVANDYDRESLTCFEDREDEKRFGDFLRFLGNKKNDHFWMEAVASVHFLAKLYGEKNEQLIFEEVHRKMRTLSRENFADIWNELWRNGLLCKKIEGE